MKKDALPLEDTRFHEREFNIQPLPIEIKFPTHSPYYLERCRRTIRLQDIGGFTREKVGYMFYRQILLEFASVWVLGRLSPVVRRVLVRTDNTEHGVYVRWWYGFRRKLFRNIWKVQRRRSNPSCKKFRKNLLERFAILAATRYCALSGVFS